MTRTMMAAAVLVLMGCASSEAPPARTANEPPTAEVPASEAIVDCTARGGLCTDEGCADSFGTAPIDAPCLLDGQPMAQFSCCTPPEE